jgi:hypothetical protein
VVSGGRLSLHGSSIPSRITRLAAPAAAGATNITVDGSSSSSMAGWSIGNQILITSSSFNPDQVEFRRIAAVVPAAEAGRAVLLLDRPLNWSHSGGVYRSVYMGLMQHSSRFAAAVASLNSSWV